MKAVKVILSIACAVQFWTVCNPAAAEDDKQEVDTHSATQAEPAAAAPAEESSPLTITPSLAVFSHYMFRGVNLYDGSSIQPSVGGLYDTGDYGTFGANVWSHVSADEGMKDADFWEIDYTLSYAYTIDAVTLSAGHIWYTYPDDNGGALLNSNEVFASASVDMPLTPTLSYYHDYDEFDYSYYELGFSHNFEPKALGEGFNLAPFVAFGFASNAADTGVYQDDGLVQTTMGVSFQIPWGIFTVKPMLAYTKEADAIATDQFWSGITISTSL